MDGLFLPISHDLHSTAIAVLHYNANSDRKQAKTKDGKDCFVLKFPKARKGEWVVQRKMEPASYGKCKLFY